MKIPHFLRKYFIQIRNNLALPYPKNGVVSRPILNNNLINQKAKHLLMKTEYPISIDNLYVIQLTWWILESQPKLRDIDDNLERAVLVLLLETEPKAAMSYLIPKQMTEERELFMETDDPKLAGVTLLKMLAMKLQEKESELQVMNSILLFHPPEDIILILQIS